MLLSGHIFLAYKLREKLKISNQENYLLGTITPDIRYFSEIPRNKTHFNIDEIEAKLNRSNNDFISGYKTHLFIDKFTEQSRMLHNLQTYFPKYIRPLMSPRVINIIVEIYFLEKLRNIQRLRISGNHTTDLSEIGITRDLFYSFINSVNEILNTLEISSVEKVFFSQNILKDNKRVKIYRRIGKFIYNQTLLRNYLVRRISSDMDMFVEDLIKSSY